MRAGAPPLGCTGFLPVCAGVVLCEARGQRGMLSRRVRAGAGCWVSERTTCCGGFFSNERRMKFCFLLRRISDPSLGCGGFERALGERGWAR